ncbi:MULTISPECIES: hypothetical protein [Methylobacterium]|uniref:Uncharacterized protein n=1 Tax=Methylobacterium thuringiense TaxID=1003091 RepID=A0ABQ4TIE0_9HYPH|nr:MULTISPECIES: hypothetical protein [Methylobacterium]TXN24500.1 hypothetical protein FV217_03245 [Methylobacterium sp. WL9]GJE54378.1 hypothetical protein EKPJFOCH_0853 [Methylobacterium thuringiense]
MSRPVTLLLALTVGLAAVPTLSHAESSKTKSTNSAAASGATQKQASGDDFEENRRAHMEKSKENNDKKGAN